jgi:hypothetical protein
MKRVILCAGVAALLAGCGSTKPTSSAFVSHALAQQVKYAQCMRAHGVPDFPEPSSTGGFTLPKSADEGSSIFRVAESACQGFARLPPGLPGSSRG